MLNGVRLCGASCRTMASLLFKGDVELTCEAASRLNLRELMVGGFRTKSEDRCGRYVVRDGRDGKP